MRKIVSFVLALALLISGTALADGDIKSEIGNQLGLEMLTRLYSYDQQALISPASLTFALSMLAAGAKGETREQLLAALNADDVYMDTLRVMLDSMSARGISTANAMFISNQAGVGQGYIDAMRGAVDAETFMFDDMLDVIFAVNDWARQKTNGLIDSILDGKPDLNLRLVLINAIAMDAKWRTPFDASNTRVNTFHSPLAGDIDIEFMNREGAIYYKQGDSYQAAYLPYDAEQLGMYVILPNEGAMADTLEALSKNGMNMLADTQATDVKLSLPKVDVASYMEMSEMLKLLGVERVFSADADLTGMAEQGGLMAGEVNQAVKLQVNEAGTIAAAVTSVLVNATSAAPGGEQKWVIMDVNRPYILVVFDGETNSILFAAAISDPTML